MKREGFQCRNRQNVNKSLYFSGTVFTFKLWYQYLDVGLPNMYPHVLLDCRQLYIDNSHFCHAAPSGIGHDCSVRNKYLNQMLKDCWFFFLSIRKKMGSWRFCFLPDPCKMGIFYRKIAYFILTCNFSVDFLKSRIKHAGEVLCRI